MGRGKVQLKQIENKISRQVTFSKRRTGLRKKAHEISVMCDAQVALIVFNAKGKLFEYSSESSMENILERYERNVHAMHINGADIESQGSCSLEYYKLNYKVELLERNLRNIAGDDLDPLSLRELQNLEQQLESALKRIRTRKNNFMNESISELQKKAKALQEQKNTLTKEIKDKEKTLAERPHCWPLIQSQNSSTLNLSPTELQSPERQVPNLTLGGTLQARKSLEVVAEARTTPSTTTTIPPWMPHHFTRSTGTFSL